MDNYIKFRYDFGEKSITDVSIHDVMNVIYRLLSPKGGIDASCFTGIVGVENKNKYGEVVKTHMHYHFVTSEKPESIRKRFLRTAERKEAYSLAVEKDVVDENRFFRYPLKQQQTEYRYADRIPLPPLFQVDVQQAFAYDEWERGTQILTRVSVRRDSRLSVYERIIQAVEESGVLFTDLYQIQDYVLDYFMENSLPPDRNKILNIVDGLAIRAHILDRNEYFRR